GRRWLVLELRERQRPVSGLNLLHVVEVSRIEKLRADDGEREVGLAAKDLADAVGLLAGPGRTDDHVAPGTVPGGATPHVAVVEGVHVDELHREVTSLLDLGVADDERVRPRSMATNEYGVSLFGVTKAVSCGV